MKDDAIRLLLGGLVAIALLVVASCKSGDPGEPFELTLLHTNDTHARIVEFNRYGSSCRDDERAEGACFGGVARRATEIRRVRAQRPHVLLLDAGDQFQGTLFYSRFRGLAAQRAMNHLGYDAMVPGNHEFDDGPEVLAPFVAGLNFPVVMTNIEVADTSALAGKLEELAILEIGGHEIGILGCLTEETRILSRPGPDVDFLAIEESLAEGVEELEAKGVNKIILLSHAGIGRDRSIAASVAGLDIIVGGHTNTLLSNIAEGAEGPYPVVVDGPRGEPVLIVTDFAWGKYLGHLETRFDAEGVVRSWEGEPILLDVSVEKDEKTLTLIEPMLAELDGFSLVTVGETTVDLVGRERVCRAAECNLGNLLADALLDAHRDQGVEIALQNAGGIRSSLSAGPITVGHILEVLPFGNTASTFSLYGKDLLAALEHGVSVAENLDNDGTGRFLQVSGLRYSWSPDAAVGKRIEEVEVELDSESFSPLDPERLYRVVTNDFTRNGGDGFTILAERAIDPYDQGKVLADIVQEHIRSSSPLAPRLEGRIQRSRGTSTKARDSGTDQSVAQPGESEAEDEL